MLALTSLESIYCTFCKGMHCILKTKVLAFENHVDVRMWNVYEMLASVDEANVGKQMLRSVYRLELVSYYIILL